MDWQRKEVPGIGMQINQYYSVNSASRKEGSKEGRKEGRKEVSKETF